LGLAALAKLPTGVPHVAGQRIGVPPEIREQLFSQRVHGPGRLGTGIGLLLTRSYLLAYDGDIGLKNTGPNGTTFEFHLPLAEADKMAEGEGLYAKAGHPID
jgi:sensor histidine kinase regulating citrate/malate metabolism